MWRVSVAVLGPFKFTGHGEWKKASLWIGPISEIDMWGSLIIPWFEAWQGSKSIDRCAKVPSLWRPGQERSRDVPESKWYSLAQIGTASQTLDESAPSAPVVLRLFDPHHHDDYVSPSQLRYWQPNYDNCFSQMDAVVILIKPDALVNRDLFYLINNWKNYKLEVILN